MPYNHYKAKSKYVPHACCFYVSFILCVMLSGIDLADMATDVLQPQGDDTARIAWNIRKKIAAYQETFSVIERVSYCSSYCVWL